MQLLLDRFVVDDESYSLDDLMSSADMQANHVSGVYAAYVLSLLQNCVQKF